jgi:hypothetical protein
LRRIQPSLLSAHDETATSRSSSLSRECGTGQTSGGQKPPLLDLLHPAHFCFRCRLSRDGGRRHSAAVRISLERFDDETGTGPRRREGEDHFARSKREARDLDGRRSGPAGTFRDGFLVEVELQYEYPDWTIERYNERMGEIRRYFDAKFGTGKLVSRSRDTDSDVIQTLVGYQWIVGGTMLELFYFSAQRDKDLFRSITVSYKAI